MSKLIKGGLGLGQKWNDEYSLKMLDLFLKYIKNENQLKKNSITLEEFEKECVSLDKLLFKYAVMKEGKELFAGKIKRKEYILFDDFSFLDIKHNSDNNESTNYSKYIYRAYEHANRSSPQITGGVESAYDPLQTVPTNKAELNALQWERYNFDLVIAIAILNIKFIKLFNKNLLIGKLVAMLQETTKLLHNCYRIDPLNVRRGTSLALNSVKSAFKGGSFIEKQRIIELKLFTYFSNFANNQSVSSMDNIKNLITNFYGGRASLAANTLLASALSVAVTIGGFTVSVGMALAGPVGIGTIGLLALGATTTFSSFVTSQQILRYRESLIQGLNSTISYQYTTKLIKDYFKIGDKDIKSCPMVRHGLSIASNGFFNKDSNKEVEKLYNDADRLITTYTKEAYENYDVLALTEDILLHFLNKVLYHDGNNEEKLKNAIEEIKKIGKISSAVVAAADAAVAPYDPGADAGSNPNPAELDAAVIAASVGSASANAGVVGNIKNNWDESNDEWTSNTTDEQKVISLQADAVNINRHENKLPLIEKIKKKLNITDICAGISTRNRRILNSFITDITGNNDLERIKASVYNRLNCNSTNLRNLTGGKKTKKSKRSRKSKTRKH